MKTSIAIFFCVLATSGFAQLIFTMDNAAFHPGLSLISTAYDGETKLSFATSGSSNAWDFSDLMADDSYQEAWGAVDIESTYCAYEFMNSTFAMTIVELPAEGDTTFVYISLDENELNIDGEYYNLDVADCYVYPDPVKYFQFPFALGDSFSDDYAYSDEETYSFTIAYLASGSITLPMGIYHDDVALISITEDGYMQYQFFADYGGHLFPCMYIDDEGYYTYSDIEMLTSMADADASSMELKHLGNQSYSVVGVTGNDCTIKVFDALGRMVQSSAGVNTFTLENLQHSVYTVEVINGQQRQTFRLLKV